MSDGTEGAERQGQESKRETQHRREVAGGGSKVRRRRRRTAGVFHQVEQQYYVVIASALAVAGAVLFIHVVYRFVVDTLEQGVAGSILKFLEGLLLVFIVAELIHTVRAVIDENVLITEPFLIVGIVAAIRRIIVITAEAQDKVGKPGFSDLMLEMGLLVGAVLLLGGTIFLLRHTEKTEPLPAHERVEDR
jgi:uncharacterized membrane protein (DUF373 family)